MLIINELREKRSTLMNQASALLHGKAVTTESRNSFDLIMKDVDILEADITRLERTAAFEAEQRNAGRPPRPQPGHTAVSADEAKEVEKRAFKQFVQFGGSQSGPGDAELPSPRLNGNPRSGHGDYRRNHRRWTACSAGVLLRSHRSAEKLGRYNDNRANQAN